MDDTYQIPNQKRPENNQQPSGQWTEADSNMMHMVDGPHDFERWTENMTGTETSSSRHRSPTSFKQEMIEAQTKENIMLEGEARFNTLEQYGQWTENFEYRKECSESEEMEHNLDVWRDFGTSSSGEGL